MAGSAWARTFVIRPVSRRGYVRRPQHEVGVQRCESAWESDPPGDVQHHHNGFEDRGHHRMPRTLERTYRGNSTYFIGVEIARARQDSPELR